MFTKGKNLIKRSNSQKNNLTELSEDIRIKKTSKQQLGSCSPLGLATCGLAYLLCPCLLCL